MRRSWRAGGGPMAWPGPGDRRGEKEVSEGVGKVASETAGGQENLSSPPPRALLSCRPRPHCGPASPAALCSVISSPRKSPLSARPRIGSSLRLNWAHFPLPRPAGETAAPTCGSSGVGWDGGRVASWVTFLAKAGAPVKERGGGEVRVRLTLARGENNRPELSV